MWIALLGLGLIAGAIIKDRQDKKKKVLIPIPINSKQRRNRHK